MPRASSPEPAPAAVPETLFLSTVPGASPSKWVDRFTSRERRVQLVNHDAGGQLAFLAPGPGGAAPRGLPQLGYLRWDRDAGPEALLRSGGIDPADVHVVRFYEEQPVVCVGREHLLAAWDPEADGPVPLAELDPAGLVDPAAFAPEPPADPLDAPEVPGSGERMAVEVVAAGAGHTILPASVARMFGRKDVVVLPLAGHPGWGVGLAWLRSVDSQLVQDFIGAAKGRRPGSSRSEAGRSGASAGGAAGGGGSTGGASGAASGGRPAARTASGGRSGRASSSPGSGGGSSRSAGRSGRPRKRR
ncbi:hypothetical protein E7744_00150 [Citricoccus sp. SGAir0253]|uniref:LysR family transcriptional regulator substrate-binding protein n=1 Tax=Citricoccus sp. SGAir0253 TaxID=2567881 RepID=UPI0010CD4DD4|nr:LysR family transcriptional regulator substrate-binding protein [Citricoccus sp. SGAir0253]QCU76821.1 hypothetical protein E7744_00150 [Citricoccus sp. SGAir0253]